MSKVFQWTKHKELWQWLADNPEMNKEDWPGWKCSGGTIEDTSGYECFACEYIGELPYSARCNCPLIWPDNHKVEANDCMGRQGLYRSWENSTRDTRVSLAKTIRDLPVREGVEWE
jgi:hypothetical protein